MRRGDIIFASFDPVRGHEQGGWRPALVVSVEDILNRPLVVTVLPGTSGRNVRVDYPWNVRLAPAETGLQAETVFLAFQVRALDWSRFAALAAGRVTEAAMARVEAALRFSLELPATGP